MYNVVKQIDYLHTSVFIWSLKVRYKRLPKHLLAQVVCDMAEKDRIYRTEVALTCLL